LRRLGCTYFSLASGFLSGKYRSKADMEKRARSPFLNKYLKDRGLRGARMQQLKLSAPQQFARLKPSEILSEGAAGYCAGLLIG
jgi:aryl-alcohol dehydrogenase-like predicted oxidoreductase